MTEAKLLPIARIHFLIVTVAVIGFGILLNMALMLAGLDSLVLRNALVMLCCYGAFFVAIRFWIACTISLPFLEEAAKQSEPYLTETKSPEFYKLTDRQSRIEELREKREYLEETEGGHNFVRVSSDNFGPGPFFLDIVFILFLILSGAITWLTDTGPSMLLDVAFDVAVAYGFIRVVRPVDTEWASRVFFRTIGAFLLLLVLSTVALFTLEVKCPGIHRLSQIETYCKYRKVQS